MVKKSRKEIDLNGKLENVLETVKEKILKQLSNESDFELKKEQSREKLKQKKRKYKDRRRVLKLKEKEIEFRSKEIELKDEDLEKRLKEVELSINLNEASSKSLCLEHKKLQEKSEELKLWEKELNKKSGELEERVMQLKSREQKFEEQVRELELKEKLVEERFRVVELSQKRIDAQQRELVSNGKKIEESSKELELKKKKVEQLLKEVKLKEKQIKEPSRKVELNHLDGLRREFEPKEKSNNIEVKVEPEENNLCSKDPNFHVCATMDGNELQIYLNERWSWKKHDSMQSEVFEILQCSSDPAKLVLDAMQGFYPPHLKKGDFEFESTVVRKTCILLFDQLMRLSPKIKDNVKNEAMELSSDWIIKMRADAEVLGFLLLVAVYGLANAFDDDKLLIYLGVVAQQSQAPKLLRALGFGDKISGFIQNLVENKQQVEAVKFVREFELMAQYPVVSLLKDYLEQSENSANIIVNDGNKSILTKNEAREKRIVDVKTVLKCIDDYKLESEFPPEDVNCLTMLIDTLENEIANSKKTPIILGPKYPPHQSKELNKKKSGKKTIRSHQAHIENLMTNHKHVDAVKYIYEKELLDKFSPVPLLKDFLAYSKTKAEDNCKKNDNSISSQIRAIRKEISALEQVIKCIKTYELEMEYSSTVLEERIRELKNQQREKSERQNEEKQLVVAEPQQETKKHSTRSEVHTTPGPTTSGPAKVTTPSTTGNKRHFSSTPKKKQPKMGNRKQPHFSENQFRNQQRGSHYDPYIINSAPRHYNLAGTPLYYDPHMWTAGIPSHNDSHMWYGTNSARIPPRYHPYMGSANHKPYY